MGTEAAEYGRYYFGEWRSSANRLTAADVAEIATGAEKARAAMASYPMDRVYRLIERVRRLWSNPDYPLRIEARALLPEVTGFSQPMIDTALVALDGLLDTEPLKKKVTRELGKIAPYAQAWRDEGGTVLRWQPLGILLHVLSGNVFLGGVGSLLEGLLTRNVNILKASSGERVFLPRFVESMRQADDDGIVSGAIALVDYASSQRDVIAEFKRQVDGIVVWGGDQAVREYRNDIPARTRVIVFGPKISLGLVTRAGMAVRGEAAVARAIADDISVWDQNACTAPQACYVEGEDQVERLAPLLAEALADRARELPAGPPDADTAVEIQKLRGVVEIAEARGEGRLFGSNDSVDWTVVVDRELSLVPTPLHRTIRLIPFSRLEDLAPHLRPMRGYLQSAGLAIDATEMGAVVDALVDWGADRIVDLGSMNDGHADDPHDGAYDLPQFMRLTYARVTLPRRPSTDRGRRSDTERPHSTAGSSDVDPWDLRSPLDRATFIDSELRTLVERARRAPFYAERLRDVRIETVADLAKVPILSRTDMEQNMPPAGWGLYTGAAQSDLQGGYVSRSGGSGGEPKFSIYDGADWEAMIACGARVFGALGLRRGDRLTNMMIPGDLYGSFVSFDQVNVRLGTLNLPFADRATPERFVDVWRKFQINAVQGLPAGFMPLLRAAKELEPTLGLDTIIFAGSSLSRGDASWLRQELGVHRIASIVGANDGGPLAYQCEAMDGALHHTIDEYNYLEIVDDDGRVVPDGEPGKMLITSLAKYAFPLIRYELGDAGRIVPGACSCGRTGRRVEHLGRADDTFFVGTAMLRSADIAAALADVRYSQLQIAVRAESGFEYLVVRLEGDLGHLSAEALQAQVVAKIPVLAKDERRFSRGLSIELLPPGALPRNPRSGKVKVTVDER